MQPNEFILSKKEHKRYLNALMRMPGTQLHKQLVLTRAMSAVIFVVIVALAFLVQLPGALQDPGRLQRLGSTTLVEIVLLAILAWFMPPWSLRRRQMRMEALNGIKGDRFKETSRVWVEDGFYIRQTGQAAANRLPLAGLQWARLGEGCGVVLQFENGVTAMGQIGFDDIENGMELVSTVDVVKEGVGQDQYGFVFVKP